MSSATAFPDRNQGPGNGVPKPSRKEGLAKMVDKGSEHSAKEEPKPVGFGKETKIAHSTKKHSLISLPVAYRLELASIARAHRKKYRTLFAAAPTLKDRAARFYRSKLPPLRRPGRPGIDSVTTAMRLLRIVKRGYPDETPACWWRRIYPLAIPNYETLSKEEQRAQRVLLRERVRSRRNQQRRRRMGE